jgi:CAAD domains of cyanobacterial aminoacyl-tRNA synthetase
MSDTQAETKVAETTMADMPNPLGINSGTSAPLAKISTNDLGLNDMTKQATEFLASLPNDVKKFYADNKSAVTTVGIVFGTIVGLKLTLAVLSAINEIPLLAPTFEMVGLGYTAWFVWRYLFRAETRNELTSELNNFKSGIFGKKDT